MYGTILAVLMAANAPSSSVLPDGTYRYKTTIAGRAIGETTIVVHRARGAVVIGESSSLAGTALLSSRTLDESTFATLSYAVDVSGKHAAVTILGTEATLREGTEHASVTAARDAPFLVSDNMVAAWAQLPATLHVTGANRVTLACVCGSFTAVPLTVSSGATGVAQIDGADGVSLTLTFDPTTYVLQRVDVPAQKAQIVLQSQDAHVLPLASPAVATPMPLPAWNSTSRDVSIRADDGVRLAGTLTIPKGALGQLPGFVLIHGSGCIDRDETIGPNKIFAQLANRLSNDGYAVLRYDKRSCGKSGGAFPVRARLIADARNAIAFLRAQPGIDPHRIFVLGHSEGGELAPSIAIADRTLAGIVLLAPPALPLEDVLLQQMLRNATAANRAQAQKKAQAQLDAIATGKKGSGGNAWLRSSLGIDPAALIAKVPCPILIVQGGKDIQVLAKDTPRLVGAANAAHRRVSVTTLPDDDHLFIKLGADETSTGVEYFTPAYLDPGLFAAIESWLRALR